MTKLKHGPERRFPLDRGLVRPRDQSLQVDLVDVLGLPPLWTKEPRVPRLRPQLADDALRTTGVGPRPSGLRPRPLTNRPASPPGSTRPAAGSADEEADHEQERGDDGNDEQPVNREAHAEQNDGQQREHDKKKHVQTSFLVSNTTADVPHSLRVNPLNEDD